MTTENLPCVLTHPAGKPPTGMSSKFWLYGNVGATRTRASPVTPPTVAITRPNWPFVLAETVNFVVMPLALLNVPTSGLGGTFFFGGGGAFWLTGNTGGRAAPFV